MSVPNVPALDVVAIERDVLCAECGMHHAVTNEWRFKYLAGEFRGWLDGRRTSEDDGHPFYLFARHRTDRVTGRLQLSIIPVDPWNVIGPVDAGPDSA